MIKQILGCVCEDDIEAMTNHGSDEIFTVLVRIFFLISPAAFFKSNILSFEQKRNRRLELKDMKLICHS